MDTMDVQRGDIYWLDPHAVTTLKSDIAHPYVIVHINAEGVILLCALTSNLKRIRLPGNILLEIGEANLPKQTVIEVAKQAQVKIHQLGAYIGTLSSQRVDQVLAGIHFIETAFRSKNDDSTP